MTDDEIELVENLGKCWNAFLDLPNEHVTENVDFMDAINAAQRLILARVGRRSYNEIKKEEM